MSDKTSAVIDMHNRISASELENIIRMQLTALKENPALAAKLPPLMVWGPPGVGKSSTIRKVAQEFGIKFIDFRLSQREPIDLRGIPVPEKNSKSVEWFVSSDFPRDGAGILLFDELTSADKSLQVAAYELILDRRLGDLYKVPDGWYIIGAGNRVEDSAVACSMSSALANRFLHVELVEDLDSFCAWAVRNNIHPAVTGFLRYRPECLLRSDKENLERGWPTPRSWERVSVMLQVMNRHGNNEALLRKLIYGLVGNRAGLEFFEYYLLNAELEDAKSMMLDPDMPIKIPGKVDRKYAFCTALSYFIWRGKDEEERAALLGGFFRISEKLTSDFACMAMCDAMSGTGIISESDAAARLFHHSGYKKWAKIHGQSMKKHLNF